MFLCSHVVNCPFANRSRGDAVAASRPSGYILQKDGERGCRCLGRGVTGEAEITGEGVKAKPGVHNVGEWGL